MSIFFCRWPHFSPCDHFPLQNNNNIIRTNWNIPVVSFAPTVSVPSDSVQFRIFDPFKFKNRSSTAPIRHQDSRARYTGRNLNIGSMYTNISTVAYPVFGVCTLEVQWECMQIVCRRSRVRHPFAYFLNPDHHRYVRV